MGLFDFFKKKKTFGGNKPIDKLVFKGNQEAYDYSKQYFSTSTVNKGEAYIGLVTSNGTMGIINVHHNNKVQEVFVNIVQNQSGKKIENKDLVLIGIEEVNKPRSFKDLANLDLSKAETDMKQMVLDAPIGVIVKKFKPILSLKTNHFEYDE